MRPVRATALYIAWSFKAFALTGRQVTAPNNPGRCPGLRASALSGRVGLTCETSIKNKKEGILHCFKCQNPLFLVDLSSAAPVTGIRTEKLTI